MNGGTVGTVSGSVFNHNMSIVFMILHVFACCYATLFTDDLLPCLVLFMYVPCLSLSPACLLLLCKRYLHYP